MLKQRWSTTSLSSPSHPLCPSPSPLPLTIHPHGCVCMVIDLGSSCYGNSSAFHHGGIPQPLKVKQLIGAERLISEWRIGPGRAIDRVNLICCHVTPHMYLCIHSFLLSVSPHLSPPLSLSVSYLLMVLLSLSSSRTFMRNERYM